MGALSVLWRWFITWLRLVMLRSWWWYFWLVREVVTGDFNIQILWCLIITTHRHIIADFILRLLLIVIHCKPLNSMPLWYVVTTANATIVTIFILIELLITKSVSIHSHLLLFLVKIFSRVGLLLWFLTAKYFFDAVIV